MLDKSALCIRYSEDGLNHPVFVVSVCLECRECNYGASVSDNTKSIRKILEVHTLHHGTIPMCHRLYMRQLW